MRDDEELRSRLAKLQSTPSRSDIQGSTSHVQDQKSLRERLNALSHNQVTSSEGEYSSRLSRLLSEREHEPSADDLAARLTRLGGSLTSTTQLPSPHEVPPGEAEDVEDLDELLEDIIEALPSGQQIEADVERGEMAPRTSEIDPKLLDQKLQDLDGMAAALLAEVAGNTSLDTKMPAQEEIQRAGMESFLGGSKEAVDGKMEAAGGMGDEEQRLFDMVNDEVRVEGHGITSPPPNQSSEKADELWLPVAPTAPPVRRPRNTGAGAAQSTLSAEIIAEQAMDEARLGLSSGTGKGNRGGRIDGPRGIGGEEDGEIWCSICPDDVTLRCHESEEESEVDNAEPELFCGPSFRETHQEDPELRSRRPHSALTSKLRKGGGKSPAKKSGNFFGKWRR